MSVAALGSDEELFPSSPQGESPLPSSSADVQGVLNVATTTPVSHLEPRMVDCSGMAGEQGADATYSMSETSFMQFEGTQFQGDDDVQPSREWSGAISMATPSRRLSRTSSVSGVEVVEMTPHSQRKCLLRLCSGEEEEEGEGVEEEQVLMIGKEGALLSEEEEEESFLMSQPVWDDIDPDR